ncbi:MAG: hypothetical protein VST68_06320 [Nitrospirota bacterium]|nr:hypothetical protein [Nitrospirota bacterium]
MKQSIHPQTWRKFQSAFGCVFLLFAMTSIATAGEITGAVKSATGKPVKNAYVFIWEVPEQEFAPAEDVIPIDQIKKEFVPHILPVLIGSTVTFPNKDQIHHHVYSFSEAKKFDRPLFRGTDVEPVVFDKRGAVRVGCKIHDTMSAIILVLQNPYFGITDKQGKYSIRNMSSEKKDKQIPPGEYKLAVWHEFMHGKHARKTRRNFEVATSGQIKVNFSLKMRR